MKDVMKYLLEGAKAGILDKKLVAKAVLALNNKEKKEEKYAIVGMDGEFAMAENISEYRMVLENGIDCITDFPKGRMEYAKNYLNYIGVDSDVEFIRGGFVKRVDCFDYGFFGISPKEAVLMDPNQKRFLQTAFNSLEDAGYGGNKLKGSNVGVFVGYDNSTVNEYRKLLSDVEPQSQTLAMAGNIIPIIASRLSYFMDFHGPSAVFDTSCSSTALALYFACLSIESGECDSAIVGSSRICMIPAMLETKLGVEAGNWKTKAFDESADGTGIGEGVGAVYVKKLEDALRDKDNIYCVIASVSANCDGDSTGITAPNPSAQAKLIVNSMKKAHVRPEEISYIEAHGTGTALGDPIEIEGIQKAFDAYTDKKQFCAIGSVKTNIGHLDHASAIASIIKCAMSLKYKEIYPTLNYEVPNKLIGFTASPVYINTKLKVWESESPRRCFINSFGLSGTNVNIVLEEAPVRKPEDGIGEISVNSREKGEKLPLTISAKSRTAFRARISRMIQYLEVTEESYQDICFTAAENEGSYRFKCVVNAESALEAAAYLSRLEENDYITESKVCLCNDSQNPEQLRTWLEDIDNKLLKEYINSFIQAEQKSDYPFAQGCGRVHLPVYPFENKSCLIKIPRTSAGERQNKKSNKRHLKTNRQKFEVIGDISDFHLGMLEDMAWIWCTLLGTEKVDVTDNFYELGGDSIFAMKFVAEIKDIIGVVITIKDIMINQTFEKIVGCVEIADQTEYSNGIVLEKQQDIREYNMTNSQKQLYAVQKLTPDSCAYNMFNAVTVKGNFDQNKFMKCVNRLVQMQEMLRTSFEDINGKFVAKVSKYAEVIPHHYSGSNVEECAKEFIRPFDLTKDILLRIGFLEGGNNVTIVMFDIHHIICDGMSAAILVRQLCKLYSEQPVDELRLNYSDYAIAVNRYEETDDYRRQEEKLLEELTGIEVLNMPTDFERGVERDFEGRKLSFDLNREDSDQIREFTKKHGLTGFHFFHAIFKILLWKYSGQEDIAVGVPAAGREDKDLSGIIGLFINTLVMRTRVNRELSCLDFLEMVKSEAVQAYDNQCISFARIIELLGSKTDKSHNPMFDIMFSMQNFEQAIFKGNGIEVSDYPIRNNVSKLDITLNIIEKNNMFNIEMEYSTALFEEQTILRMLDNYGALIVQCIKYPDKKLKELTLSEKELSLLKEFETNKVPYDTGETVKACIEKRVQEMPEAGAVLFRNEIHTYSELNHKANQLAGVIRKKGLTASGNRMAIICRRSPEMIIGILAAVKSGIAYLPLDPDYPMDRLRYILEDSKSKCVLHYKVKRIWDQEKVLSIDLALVHWQTEIAETQKDPFTPSVPMYMIYTSGSTGLPKGVSVTQRNVRNFILGMNKEIPFKKGQRLLSVTTIGFDIFVLESSLALANGLEIVLASEETIDDMDALCMEIIESKIDILQTTPSRIRAMMVSAYFEQAMRQLNCILIGGEPFPKNFLTKFRSFHTRVFNVYGPTETTVWSTVGELTESNKVHVGRPIANTDCVVLDASKKRVPVGCIGELAIGGDGVSDGYHNRDELNQEKFVTIEGSSGRYFMTGDFAYWDNKGHLIITGRNDRMVKLNGYRIELDEIQSVIASISQIRETAVFIIRENYLIACCSLKGQVSETEIVKILQTKVPEYMIPNKILIWEELPHTPNGKLDINQMKAMIKEVPVKDKGSHTIPETKTQKELLMIWQSLLNSEDLGIDDNLFESGANSLKVIEFISMIKRKCYDIVINDIFANPTVRELEDYIVNRREEDLLNSIQEVEAAAMQELAIHLSIKKMNFDQSYVLYFVADYDETKELELKQFASEKVNLSLVMTDILDMDYYVENITDIVQLHRLLGLRKHCDGDLISDLDNQCSAFETAVLSKNIEKEYRMAAIQHYFLSSERYSGTILSFKMPLDLKKFNEALRIILNEQGLFKADIIKKNSILYWRQRDEIDSICVPYVDLSKYIRKVQFELVDKICKEIYFKEYKQIRDLYTEDKADTEYYGLLYRMLLIKISENEYYLILPVNHAIFDAMSGEVVKRRVLEIYSRLMERQDPVSYPQLTYADFVEQTRMGPVNISQKELINVFELKEYLEALACLHTAISVFPSMHSTYIRFEMKTNEVQDKENAWSRAFEVLRVISRDYIRISRIPFMIYYYGRKYLGREYFESVGEFIDMIPMSASTEDASIAVQDKAQNIIKLSETYNVNFSTLALHNSKKKMEGLESIVNEINRKTAIVFNFQGKLEENDMSVFEKFLYERLMHELNMEEARNIHVMTRYSSQKIQMDINLPFEINDDSLEQFLKNQEFNITDYEQKIIIN